ncbi:hypothetical protein [Runella sp.]|uniref:hypothetical protein n=1 Tax=Runella sp. TaxID=1960881 RepID=UPI002612122D|nr:hypothetical protein [Runella sp.]
MNKILVFITLIAFCIVSGCSKNESVDKEFFMTWKANGVDFKAATIKANYYSRFRELKIEATAGKDFNLDGITFDLFDFTTTSPTILGNGEALYLGNCLLDRYWTRDTNPGILTVTKFNDSENIIEGEFSFEALGNTAYFDNCNTTKRTKVSVTNGKFRIKYDKQ